MTMNVSIRDRGWRIQGDLSPALESEVGPSSNFGKARSGLPASDEVPAMGFTVRPSDRTIPTGLNSRVEPVSTMAPFTLNAVSSLARGSA